jgi:hypothetical protein
VPCAQNITLHVSRILHTRYILHHTAKLEEITGV